MRARIDITEVEARTKIRAKYLRAIENEEWDLLPGAVYVKSFLRTYGDFLGLDSALAGRRVQARYERPSEQELRADRPPRARASAARAAAESTRGRRAWLIIGGVVVWSLVVLGARRLARRQRRRLDVDHRAHVKPAPRTAHDAAPSRPASAPRAPERRRVASCSSSRPATVYVCLVDGDGQKLIPGVMYNAGQTIPTEPCAQAAADARQHIGADAGQRQAGRRRRRRRPRSATSCTRAAAPPAAGRPGADAARERRPRRRGRDPGHGHRGPDRDHLRPQRPVAVRAPARARRRRWR